MGDLSEHFSRSEVTCKCGCGFNNVSPDLIHFLENMPTTVVEDLNHKHIGVYFIDGATIDDAEGLLRAIAAAFDFPDDQFGPNWNSLDECLTDLAWCSARGYVLVVKGGDALWRIGPRSVGTLIGCWLNAAGRWSEEEVPFHLVFLVEWPQTPATPPTAPDD